MYHNNIINIGLICLVQKEGARPPATRAPVTTRAPVIIPSTTAGKSRMITKT